MKILTILLVLSLGGCTLDPPHYFPGQEIDGGVRMPSNRACSISPDGTRLLPCGPLTNDELRQLK